MSRDGAWDDWYVPDGEGFKPVPEDFDLARWHRDKTDWIVGKTLIESPLTDQEIEVSTVFLFLNHGWRGGIQLWESLVFGADGTPMADYQERYSTYADAKAGHDRIVQTCRDMALGTQV
jgi:hypothetical protein